jgi:hypothetical protein
MRPTFHGFAAVLAHKTPAEIAMLKVEVAWHLHRRGDLHRLDRGLSASWPARSTASRRKLPAATC